jgi:coenzyme F420-0:L-glutamate ligase/coenzyme F420-1:gamma-L-glutamate ligase
LKSLSIRALEGLPEISAGDDLAKLIVDALGSETLGAGRLLAIAQKAVSKAEGATVALSDVHPEARARDLAASLGKDPRFVQVVLDESLEVLRAERGVLICRTHHGLVCANAGVDTSNARSPEELILLPRHPDESARRIRARLRELMPAEDSGAHADGAGAPAVLISDSFGRAWRHAQVDVAIGLAGMQPADDWRGRMDSAGLQLQATWLAVADAAAAAADLARAKDSREPVVLIDGLERFFTDDDGPGASALLRPLDEDMFR